MRNKHLLKRKSHFQLMIRVSDRCGAAGYAITSTFSKLCLSAYIHYPLNIETIPPLNNKDRHILE